MLLRVVSVVCALVISSVVANVLDVQHTRTDPADLLEISTTLNKHISSMKSSVVLADSRLTKIESMIELLIKSADFRIKSETETSFAQELNTLSTLATKVDNHITSLETFKSVLNALSTLAKKVDNHTTSMETFKSVQSDFESRLNKTDNSLESLARNLTTLGSTLKTIDRRGIDGDCDFGWSKFCHSQGCNCYRVVTERMTYFRARAECRKLYADLVSVHSEAEHEFVFGLRQTHSAYLWIGLTDFAEEGKFVWSDGSALTYQGWAGGEPNNNPNPFGDGEDCVVMDTLHHISRWFDFPCSPDETWKIYPLCKY